MSYPSLRTVYQVSLAIGLILPLLNLILGGLFDGLDWDFDFDLDSGSLHTLLPLNPTTILAFLLVFGGTGLYLSPLLPPVAVFPIAILSGWLVGAFFYQFVLSKLKNQETGTLAIHSLVGQTCQVSVRVRRSGVGAVVVVAEGRVITYSAELSEEEPDELLDTGITAVIVTVDEKRDLVRIKRVAQETSGENR